jgi:acetyl esterase/lipase
MKTHRFLPVLATLIVSLVTLGTSLAQKAPRQIEKPRPTLVKVHYGEHERQVLDFWKAKSDKPTPLVVFIHGGGFRAGSKEGIPSALFALLDKGISLMAINYRFSPGVTFPAHYMDSARSIQYARHHAKEWNIDPRTHRRDGRLRWCGHVVVDRLSRRHGRSEERRPRAARIHAPHLHGRLRCAIHV